MDFKIVDCFVMTLETVFTSVLVKCEWRTGGQER